MLVENLETSRKQLLAVARSMASIVTRYVFRAWRRFAVGWLPCLPFCGALLTLMHVCALLQTEDCLGAGPCPGTLCMKKTLHFPHLSVYPSMHSDPPPPFSVPSGLYGVLAGRTWRLCAFAKTWTGFMPHNSCQGSCSPLCLAPRPKSRSTRWHARRPMLVRGLQFESLLYTFGRPCCVPVDSVMMFAQRWWWHTPTVILRNLRLVTQMAPLEITTPQRTVAA
jgi:hypothetical protein